jgi:PleD family two-component response regulator
MSHRRKKRKLKQKYFLRQKAQINADSVEKKSHHLPDYILKNMAMAGLFTRPHHYMW